METRHGPAIPAPAEVAAQSTRLATQLLALSANLRSAPWRTPPEVLREGEQLLADAIAAALALAGAAQPAQPPRSPDEQCNDPSSQ